MGFMKNYIVKAQLGLLIFFAQSQVFARPASRLLPALIEHSHTTLSVAQGDTLNLSVVVEGRQVLLRWVKDHKTLCKKVTCSFDTTDWSLGRHRLVALAYNSHGSRAVAFRVRVLAREDGQAVETKTPKMKPAEKPEVLRADDLYVRSFLGIGYSFHNRKVQVVGQYPRLLTWDEKLKSHNKGVIQFGRRRQEEHFVLPQSSVALAKSDSGRKVIQLLDGDIRSRQLEASEPTWTILVDDWLQLDTDSKGDVIVMRSGDRVRVSVLRGYARVYYRLAESGTLEEGKSSVVPPGSQIEFRNGRKPNRYERLDYRSIRRRFHRSSPQYIRSTKQQRKGSFISPSIRENSQQPVKEATAKARALVETQDYLLAIEQLLPLYKRGKNNFELNMLLGDAYYGLSLLKQANRYYRQASELEENSPEVAFAIALLHMESRNWPKMIAWLDKADDLNHPNWQALHYYRGVATFNLEELPEARSNFRYSLWEVRNRDMDVSARKFLTRIRDDRPYGAVGRAWVGYDSNIFRVKTESEH